MTTIERKTITVEVTIKSQVEKAWSFWTDPKHIIKWNNASEDWHTTKVENDLIAGGRFLSRMEAKDGSMGFDFSGEYSSVVPYKQIKYTLDDDRKVQILFVSKGNETTVIETFETESENTVELQKSGWQAILDNFKKHVEESVKSDPLKG